MQTILMNDLNDYVTDVTLDGEEFRLYFGWNDTGEFWNLGIFKNNTALIQRLRIVPNYPLLRQYRRDGFPAGEFIAVVLDDKAETIGRNDFINGKAFFCYMSEDELNAI